MIYDVILRKTNNKYIARAKEWPEVIVEENTRNKAIQQIKTRLIDYLTNQVEIIKIEIPLPTETGNPWLDKFGWFKDDPTFDDLQAEMAAYRQEIDLAMEQIAE
ncbi:MAG TPA: hypothetical protein G4N96_05565 [Chloroflexi bacterium]|nr:MAG: hypothetical protein B6243_04290 [Anaerolineaceae bacterium 4572_5.2]HEY84563.1 hypothetical protein [Chloroflexota bacterium]